MLNPEQYRPLDQLTEALREFLEGEVEIEPRLHPEARWRPHLYEPESNRAWYLLTAQPYYTSWVDRVRRALDLVDGLRVGLCGPEHVLGHEAVLLPADRLGLRLLPAEENRHGYELSGSKVLTAGEYVYRANLPLPPDVVSSLLDQGYERVATDETGVHLEQLTALLLSQVRGFSVSRVNLRTRTEEIDIELVNRNSSGVLAGSHVVLVECKDRSKPLGRSNLNIFLHKMKNRRGRCKLGFIFSESRFTTDLYDETLRFSQGEELVVLVHGDEIPHIWRSGRGITEELEDLVLDAVNDQSA